MILRLLAMLLACAACWPLQAPGRDAPSTAADPQLEARVNRLGEELRCLVCQNQTIADSHADLALDLKRQIREQIGAGRSDSEIIDYMVARYGDFILYRPPLKATTLLLWVGPFAMLAGAFMLLLRYLRVRSGRLQALETHENTGRPGPATLTERA